MFGSETAYVCRNPNRALRPCPCGCGQRGICDEHRARLAAIRADLEAELHSYSPSVKRSRSPRVATCCAPDCWEPREHGHRFCVACEDAGWTEDTGE